MTAVASRPRPHRSNTNIHDSPAVRKNPFHADRSKRGIPYSLRTTKAEHGWCRPSITALLDAGRISSHQAMLLEERLRSRDAVLLQGACLDGGRAYVKHLDGTKTPTGYRVVRSDSDLDSFQRELSRAIVANGVKATSGMRARYYEAHFRRRAQMTVAVLERHLPYSIHELRLCVSKRRNGDEQVVYEALARFVRDQKFPDEAAVAAALNCHPRTIERMTAWVDQNKRTEEATVVDITMVRRIARMADDVAEIKRDVADISERISLRWPNVSESVDRLIADSFSEASEEAAA